MLLAHFSGAEFLTGLSFQDNACSTFGEVRAKKCDEKSSPHFPFFKGRSSLQALKGGFTLML